MSRKLYRGLRAAALLTAAFACGGGRASMQKSAPAAKPAAAAKQDCATWQEVVNAAFLQVTERPAHGELAKTSAERLARGEMSVRELVAALALSDEYKERFVAARPNEEVVRLLYQHLLARKAEPAELMSAATAAAKDLAPLVKSLVEGDEYGRRFGAMRVPGAPASLRPCRFPFKLSRRDDFGAGREVTTEITVESDGRFRATTRLKGPARKEPFCAKVGLWLLGEGDGVVGVAGPPRETFWCVGGSTPDREGRTEEWQGSLPQRALDAASALAVLQTAAGVEPQSVTRENTERAQQIKQPLR